MCVEKHKMPTCWIPFSPRMEATNGIFRLKLLFSPKNRYRIIRQTEEKRFALKIHNRLQLGKNEGKKFE